MSKLVRAGNIVRLTQKDFMVEFDTNYGGAPLGWWNLKNGKQVVNPFAGEGAQSVWDSGQDGTMASGSGPDSYRIGIVGQSPVYFAREEAFLPAEANHEALYQVAGTAPYFWISHEAADDSIPTDSRGDNGWSTAYHDILNLGASFYEAAGTPICGVNRGAINSGILCIGDEILSQYHPELQWNERLCRIENGNIAFRICISLRHADSSAIAAVFFRKTIPDTYGATVDTAYNAPGAALYVNKLGGVDLQINGVTTTVIPNNTPGMQTAVNSETGINLEIKSNFVNDSIDIYVEGILRRTFSCPVSGPHTALFYQCANGYVKFSYRQFFDIGTNLVSSFRSTVRNTLLWNAGVYRVADPYYLRMYRTNLPVVFTHPTVRQAIKVWDTTGKLMTTIPGLYELNDVGALYSGLDDGSAGVFCLIKSVGRCTGFTKPHCGIWTNAIALNVLSQDANEIHEDVTYDEIVSEWAPEIRYDLLEELSNAA